MGFSGLPARRTTHAFFSQTYNYRSNRRRPELLFDYFQVFRTVSH
jgi:hypothetical protein